MLLARALYNFEPIQIDVKKQASPSGVRSHTRADQQEQAHELEAMLVARYRSGETVKALTREYGMHHQTVRQVLVDAGVSVRRRQRLSDDDLAEVRRHYEAGATTTELGDQFGVHASTIQRALKRLGVERRAAGWRPPELRT